ncbi:class I SAM-dependent methyltransferase [Nocardia sp. CA-128927]|uniref:class I SAM-dependent methyltransferase n=1 Tax=Nocardia sp. CA-128927 TaxID=3239975 RepID=UPI003D953E5B
MYEEHSSETAVMAAAARAAHLIVDQAPLIFSDPLAVRLLGDRADELISYHRLHGDHPILSGARAQTAVRSRVVEDRLALLTEHGLTQYVILGAGLDTFAYRDHTKGLRVFEVDHPATQQWKQHRLAATAMPIPGTVSFVPVDFDDDPLADRLIAAGFDPTEPALISWLGVTMYLTWDAIDRTLATLSGFAPGTELVLDYLLPEHLRDEAGNTYAKFVGQVAADGGEPWLTCPTPEEMTVHLADHGFGPTKHLGQRDAIDTELWQRSDSLTPAGLQMLAHATKNTA